MLLSRRLPIGGGRVGQVVVVGSDRVAGVRSIRAVVFPSGSNLAAVIVLVLVEYVRGELRARHHHVFSSSRRVVGVIILGHGVSVHFVLNIVYQVAERVTEASSIRLI